MSAVATPVSKDDRILALDVLRGVAVLGILIMNVQAFAMPGSAYTNPASYGDLSGINRFVWIVSHVTADLKFMTIFSLLFGAGVCLFADRAQAKRGRSAGLHYRRTLLLLVVGLLHGYLLFYGDILVPYALCALWVYLLRNRRPRTLLVVATLLVVVPTLLNLLIGAAVAEMSEQERVALQAAWAPPPDQIQAYLDGMRGSFTEQVATRAPLTAMLETMVFGLLFFWRVSAVMLIGMALFRTGVITGERSPRFYRRLAAIGLGVGLALSTWGVVLNFRSGWSFEYSMFYGAIPNYYGSLAVALGYLALVMLWVAGGRLSPLRERLAATGRMAFTNYIAQSVLCVLLFNGLGWIGELERWEQVLVVLCVWTLQLLWSPYWLARHRFGPLEWLWRAGTYGRAP